MADATHEPRTCLEPDLELDRERGLDTQSGVEFEPRNNRLATSRRGSERRLDDLTTNTS